MTTNLLQSHSRYPMNYLKGFCFLLLLVASTLSAQSRQLTAAELAQLQSLSPQQRAELASGNTQNLSPAQAAQFQALSADQRAALLSSASSQATSPNPTPSAPAPGETPTPRPVASGGGDDGIQRNARQAQGTEQIEESVEVQVTSDPLTQFGYDLFAGTPSTFAPTTNIPVPLNYVIGPNDSVIVQLYGQINSRYEITVTREGVLQFPEVGPINVAGLTFGDMRELIETTVATSLIGQQVSITMGALRSIQIFVLGEAFRPGSYTVSSLSTMTNALFSSGGVTRVGSLRDIRLMRQGQLITSLDLYDLLLRGDTSGDVRLQPNDVIFIPPIGKTVGISGEVRRPAIFELRTEESIQDILPLAGGFLSTAYPGVSRLERINDRGERTLIDVDLGSDETLQQGISDGDVLQIYSILDQIEGVVMLEGHVNRPGGFEWREGLRVTDVLPGVANMLPNPDLDYALISREVQPNRTLEVINIDLRAAFADAGSAANLLLEPRDRILTFGARSGRQAQVQRLVTTLRDQSTFDSLPLTVGVQGNVLFPGDYPLLSGMQLDDLIRFSGGLNTNADLDYVLVQRQIDLEGRIEVLSTQFDPITLKTVEPFALQPEDQIIIFNANQARDNLLSALLNQLRIQADTSRPTQIVSVIGNVRFPGLYPLQQGFRVEDLISIAGGLTESAETRIAEITRYESDPSEGREVGHLTLDLSTTGATGRDLALQPFDQLIIRQMANWADVETVSILGEVNSPGVYVITQNETMENLIKRAGGLTRYADPEAAVFLRESLRETEARLLEEYRNQLETDIITLRLQQSVVSQSGANRVEGQGQSEAIQLLDRIQNLEPVGRLVIDLPSMLAGGNNVILRDGDELMIPRLQQEITITGEVFRPTSHLYQPQASFSDYIAMSGGLRDDADTANIYVVRKSGALEQIRTGNWFFQDKQAVRPGDTIVVPFDAYQPYGLFIWSEIAQIVSSLSTTLLLIHTVTDSSN